MKQNIPGGTLLTPDNLIRVKSYIHTHLFSLHGPSIRVKPQEGIHKFKRKK